MFTIARSRARLTAVLGMVAAASVAFAGPASASPGVHNTAAGIVAAGTVNAGPFAASNFPDGPGATPTGDTDTVASASASTLLTSGTISTFAGPSSATASVENLKLTLGPEDLGGERAIITFERGFSASCAYGADGRLSGETTLASATVTQRDADRPVSSIVLLDTNPAPNTTIPLGFGNQYTLNRQTTNPDGSLTVDALFIELVTGQTFTVASVTCQPTVLVIPVIAPAFAVGAGVLALLGVGLFLYRRRQNAVDVA